MTAPIIGDKGAPLGRKIASLRVLRGWSQVYLAAELQMAPETLSRIENGKMRPSTRRLVQLSRLFDVTLDELIRDTELAAA